MNKNPTPMTPPPVRPPHTAAGAPRADAYDRAIATAIEHDRATLLAHAFFRDSFARAETFLSEPWSAQANHRLPHNGIAAHFGRAQSELRHQMAADYRQQHCTPPRSAAATSPHPAPTPLESREAPTAPPQEAAPVPAAPPATEAPAARRLVVDELDAMGRGDTPPSPIEEHGLQNQAWMGRPIAFEELRRMQEDAARRPAGRVPRRQRPTANGRTSRVTYTYI